MAFEIKVGTKISELKQYVSNSTSLSAEQKQSIILALNDDLDQVVSHSTEARMYKQLLSGKTKASMKFAGIQNPTYISVDDGSKVVFGKTRDGKDVEYGSFRHGDHTNNNYDYAYSGYEDYFKLDDNCRVVGRTTYKFGDERFETYYDDNLDGIYDRKTVSLSNASLNYTRDNQGRWIMDM